MKKRSLAQRFIMACSLTLMSATLFSTASYAWFSRNRVNDVNGLGFTSRMISNLKITEGYCSDPDIFTDADVFYSKTPGSFLQPVSSCNGLDFFANTNFTNGVNEIGAISKGARFEKINGADMTTYYSPLELALLGVKKGSVKAYAEYVYSIKVASADWEGEGVSVYLQDVTLSYKGSTDASSALNAFRVSIFTEEYDETTDTWGDFVNHGVLMRSDSLYFETNKAISGVFEGDTNIVRSDVTLQSDNLLRNFKADVTKYFAITIRVWLEGEDIYCNDSKFRKLTDDYNLSVTVGLSDPEKHITINEE